MFAGCDDEATDFEGVDVSEFALLYEFKGGILMVPRGRTSE